MKDSPRGWGQLFASVCTDLGLTRLKRDECVFVKFVNNSKSRIQNMQPNLPNIIEATAFVPENIRICSDSPHATVILIIASYVDGNLAFTNCAALAAEFEVHCNVKFPMHAKGPFNWYLSVKYDRDPTTGAVSAHQHFYIDKLLEKWGMEQCHPLPTPFPQKADDIIQELAEPVATHDEKLVKEYQALVGSFLYLQVHTFPEISWAVSVLSNYMIRPGPSHLVMPRYFCVTSKGAGTSLFNGALKIAHARNCQARSMDMPMHPLLIRSHIDIHQSDTSSSSTALLSPGVRVRLL